MQHVSVWMFGGGVVLLVCPLCLRCTIVLPIKHTHTVPCNTTLSNIGISSEQYQHSVLTEDAPNPQCEYSVRLRNTF